MSFCSVHRFLPDGTPKPTSMLIPRFAAALLTIAVGSWAADPLPPENTLPEKSASVAAALPAETVMPGDRSGGEITQMPDESLLPPRGECRPPGDGRNNFDQDTPGDQQPILRLNYPAHVGQIRDVAILGDGQRMVSAGDDKDLHVWSRDPRDRRRWIDQRTIRWQVWRGNRGRIRDLDVAGRRIAVGGHGATGGNGEVVVFDVATGERTATLADHQNAHRQVIDSVVWSPDGRQIATADLAGRVVRWRPDAAGRWIASSVAAEDRQSYGPETTGKIAEFRGFHPLAWLEGKVLHPRLFSPPGQGRTLPRWRLERSDDAGPLPGYVDGLIADLQVADRGRVIAAAAMNQFAVLLWRRDEAGDYSLSTIPIGGPPVFATLDERGNRLLVGIDDQPGVGPPSVRVYDCRGSEAIQTGELTLNQIPAAGCFDGFDGVVLAVGSELRVHDLAGGQLLVSPRQTLASPVAPVLRVAAAAPPPATAGLIVKPPPIQVGISRSIDAEGQKVITEVFDLRGVTLRRAGQAKDDQFLPAQRLTRRWTIKPSKILPGVFDLYADDRAVGHLPFDRYSGKPTTLSTAATGGGDLVIVGTDGQNNLYVFDANEDVPNDQTLMPRRVFRGHRQTVRSTSATADGRYLISGGDDGLVMLWNLDAVAAEPSIHRWGAVWTVDQSKMLVDRIDEAGPLYFRGVRAGDVLRKIRWTDRDGSEEIFEDPAAIVAELASVPLTAQVAFHFERQGSATPEFQMFPAWYPLATLMIDAQRNWAMWTPPGIYDASITGDRRFGWQLNRGLFRPVEFFRADQFRRSLQRPGVMRQLVDAGSLAGAMRKKLAGGPASNQDMVLGQIRSRPSIKVLSPVADAELAGSTVDVIATIECPPGHAVAATKAFLGGIPGVVVGDPNDSPRRWRFELPRQREMQLEVLATTTAGVAGRQMVSLRRSLAALNQKPARTPRLHLIALGVGNYRDAAITTLDFPARATDRVAATVRQYASGLYDVTTEQLVDDQATRPLWRVFAGSAAERLRRTAGPDDLLVIYLCGHGLRDRRSDQWYFVTADARYRDLMDDRYDDCLSLSDLSAFAEVPCRKLAIIDSCHAGAVQANTRPDDLRTLLRFLQEDVVMTLTASEGGEEAAEVRATGLGRFTARIVEGFKGGADVDGDQIVRLRELVDYVTAAVAQDAADDGASQHPVAAPADLIQRLDLPLSRLDSRSTKAGASSAVE